MNEAELTEKLAALEHDQWSNWTRYFLRGKHTPEDLHRWVRQMEMGYDELSEEDKEKDRIWARKVLQIFKEAGVLK